MQLRLKAVLDIVEENVLYGYEEVLLDPTWRVQLDSGQCFVNLVSVSHSSVGASICLIILLPSGLFIKKIRWGKGKKIKDTN
jgi:hypothetical protein